MDDTELKNLLATYNHKLEESKLLNMQSWALNFQCFETLQQQKAKSKLKSLINFKINAVVLGILWVGFLGFLFFRSLEMHKIFFLISVGADHVNYICSDHCVYLSHRTHQ